MTASAANREGIRPGEIAIDSPVPGDALLHFIGRIRTPWASRLDCPRQGRPDGPVCCIEVFEPWVAALDGISAYQRIEVIYWMHLSRRDLVRQSPRSDGMTTGTFALRSPVRPNPIATSLVELVSVEGSTLLVRGLDCVDGTPLLDMKPDRCAYTPPAPQKPSDERGNAA
jgi:tRNA-Thr(GGU) m(6)t(6)A37 methyltransferase TsaA